jgi:Raf kinase inhibitor-like YbhB/YbcL family protein
VQLTSSAFPPAGSIPAKYTCDGAGVSPPLQIAGVPAGSRGLALIVYDPDVPRSIKADGRYSHWVLWNLPPGLSTIEEHRSGGVSEGGHAGYIPPCPPNGEHRYIFQLFALDKSLGDEKIYLEQDLRRVMQGHIVEQTELVGRYTSRTSSALNLVLPGIAAVVLAALAYRFIAARRAARSTSAPR